MEDVYKALAEIAEKKAFEEWMMDQQSIERGGKW